MNIYPVVAQQELCRDIGEVASSETLRTLELPQFGINIDIPENYRALARNDGSVEILDPGNFELASCVARGGEVTFGRGTSSFTIRLVNNSRNLPLLTLSQQEGGYDGNHYRYNLVGTQAIITESSTGYYVGAWFAPPTIDDVVVMEVSCDCELSRDDIVMELDNTRLR
ncbi:MAG: hypothetical protein HC873_21920 [Leptolyngbyaceae cyanobacterium SL_1_1]|nr:hypothetical protein [Leptolyngbyaceae cyanobacterium SL_1_1]